MIAVGKVYMYIDFQDNENDLLHGAVQLFM